MNLYATKIIKIGEDAGVLLPDDFAKKLGLKKGDKYDVRLDKKRKKVIFDFHKKTLSFLV